jgi:hypothetical protein
MLREFIALRDPRPRTANLFYMRLGFLLQTKEGAVAYVENVSSFIGSLALRQL